MLARRITRDVKERGRSVDGILEQYLRYVKPSFDNFVQPSSAHADIVRSPRVSFVFSLSTRYRLYQGQITLWQ